MSDGKRDRAGSGAVGSPRRARRPILEALEERQLLASLALISDVSVPTTVGYQLPLDGSGSGAPQTFQVLSNSNANVQPTIARGQFLTVNVHHDSSGSTDPAFDGTMTFQLFDDLTPITASKIEQLVTQGFYTSPTTGNDPTTGKPYPTKNFHRVLNGFVVQAGSQTGNGAGSLNQAGFPFTDEYNQQLVYDGKGQLAMANAGADTNDSQFFVTLASPRSLDFNKTIFGQIVAGQDTLTKIANVAVQSDPNSGEKSMPIKPVLITATTLSTTNPNGVLHIDTTKAKAGESSTIVVQATDQSGASTTQTFHVNVVANNDPANNNQPINELPFLAPIPNQTVAPGKSATFHVSATDAEATDQLTYKVAGGVAPGQQSFTAVQNATATVDNNGNVTVTPNPGFTGSISLLVGVRDQVVHSPATALEAPANYGYHLLTVNVTSSAGTAPTANAATVSTQENTQIPIQLTATPGTTGQTLTYAIVNQPSHGTISVVNANAGTFSYTPASNFVGTDSFAFTATTTGLNPNLTSAPAAVTVNVTSGTGINHPPTANSLTGSSTVQVVNNVPTTVQLSGNANDAGQTLTFQITTQPTHGTISNLNAQTGSFTYTPASDYIGPDSLTFTTTDVGPPTPNLTSAPATVAFSVNAGVTNAVRLETITNAQTPALQVLFVTPPPRTDHGTNTITVHQVGDPTNGPVIQVNVNGVVDSQRPAVTSLSQIVVYGSKASDKITVGPEVTLPTTLDGGHGGQNVLQAGGGPTREHGWFGLNTLIAGPGATNDALIGRAGHVRFVRDSNTGQLLIFAGNAPHHPGSPPTGTFFRFAGTHNRLVPISAHGPSTLHHTTTGTTTTQSVHHARQVATPAPARKVATPAPARKAKKG